MRDWILCHSHILCGCHWSVLAGHWFDCFLRVDGIALIYPSYRRVKSQNFGCYKLFSLSSQTIWSDQQRLIWRSTCFINKDIKFTSKHETMGTIMVGRVNLWAIPSVVPGILFVLILFVCLFAFSVKVVPFNLCVTPRTYVSDGVWLHCETSGICL